RLYTLLADLRLKSSYMSIKELAEHIVYSYGFDKYVLTQDGGDYKLSALNTYLDSLNDLSIDCSLSEYVATFDNSKMEIKGGAKGNTVKAMTIHKSKGLEFPIVFVCNIEKPLTMKSGFLPKLLINKDAGIAINYFDEENMVARRNLAFDIMTEKNQMDDKAEAMRLFYVALTRPKNHIILTGTAKEKDLYAKNPFKADSFLDWVLIAANQNNDLQNRITFHNEELKKVDIMQRYSFKKYQGDNIPIIDKYINFEYKTKKAEKLSIKHTVTEINKQGGTSPSFVEADDIVSDNDSITTQFDTAKRGTAYHEVLENINFNAKTCLQIESELKRLLDNGILLAEELKEIDINDIVAIMNTPVMEYARQNRCYREQEFTLYINANEVLDTSVQDKIYVHGIIDLLIVGEQVWIVDYKKSDESTQVLKERYQKQLELYAKAVQNGIERKVDKAMLFVIGRNEVID
ncbi:MAG: PD-(D/E)XK nuclease family protein, partial [Clostridia bacterium]|nr:PD-(D/E)XK nuclease family protein [Clostridia bacterium]